MNKWLQLIVNDLAALLLGVMLTLAFAPFEIFPFAILAPAGLVYLWLSHPSKWRAFWLGFLFGVGLFTSGVYWVFHSVHVFGGVPVFPAALITAGMIAILSLYPALVGYALNRYFTNNNATKIICAFPAIWVFSEWLRSLLLSGFPWLFVGYSQTNSPLKGYAPLLSVYGVSLAALITSGLLVFGIKKFRLKEYVPTYLCLLAITLIWISGSALNLIAWTKPDRKPISLSLVQGNIPQELKWSPEHLQLSFDRYQQLTEPLWGKSDFIIWPEAAIPMTLENADTFISEMESKAQSSGSRLILGIPVQNQRGKGYFNAVVLLGEKEKLFYYKRQLVPFGEYVPFENFLSQLFNFLNIPVSELVPSHFSSSMLIGNGIKIQTSICYEIAFPELSKINDPTINILLTVTNDAWFGESSAQAQHLQMAMMRAIELRRPVVFVSNDGITAIITPFGQVQASIPVRTADVLTGKVQPMMGVTPWMYYGMDPILFILLSLIAYAFVKERRARKYNLVLEKNNVVT